MMIFFFIGVRKIKRAFVTVSFYSEQERKKEHFITVISSDKWYYFRTFILFDFLTVFF